MSAIRSLGERCATKVKDAEARALARQIIPLLSRKEPEVRAAAAQALGAIASPEARIALRRAVADRYRDGVRICETRTGDAKQRCRDSQPVRDAARAALERIDALSAARPVPRSPSGE